SSDVCSSDLERVYSEHLYCPFDELSFEELEPRSFSFNSPFGACPECAGLGNQMEVDPELVVPDPSLSIDEGALAPWGNAATSEYFNRRSEEHTSELQSRENVV